MQTSGPTSTTLNLGQSLTIFQHSHRLNDLCFLILEGQRAIPCLCFMAPGPLLHGRFNELIMKCLR